MIYLIISFIAGYCFSERHSIWAAFKMGFWKGFSGDSDGE